MRDVEREKLKEECIAAYKHLRLKSPNKTPTNRQFLENTKIKGYMLKRAFGSGAYSKLQAECGDTPNKWSQSAIPADEIFKQYGELVRLRSHDEGLPTSTDWQFKDCRPRLAGLLNRFTDTWSEMPAKFLDWAKDKDEWNDAVAIIAERSSDLLAATDTTANAEFELVITHVRNWIPDRKRRTEEAYQVGLRKYLESLKCTVAESVGQSEVDLVVDGSVAIELKKSPADLAEYDRCFGQIARHLRHFDHVIVLVCDPSHSDRLKQFEQNVDRIYVAHGMNVVVMNK